MARFSEIIKNLHVLRQETLEASRKKRSKSNRKPKIQKPIEFDSPELNAIFGTMAPDLQAILKKAAKKK